MKQSINILFLGGAKRLSLAERFIEAGKRLGKNINIFSYELDQNVPISHIATVIIGLKWKDPKLEDHLKRTITKHNINVILPFVDQSISILSKLKVKIGSKVMVPVSDTVIVDILFDKNNSNTWFLEQGFPIPESNENSFPLIAKPRKGSASKGIKVIENKLEFQEFLKINNRTEFLFQKFIDAIEYTVDCYVNKEREILGIVPRIRIEVAQGEVTKGITKRNAEIIELSNKILQAGKFWGPITIQFLMDKKTNQLFLMEINPRFGGGVIN
nr:ATP-grasp domain-containing protein [Bacteroidales bacterium]